MRPEHPIACSAHGLSGHPLPSLLGNVPALSQHALPSPASTDALARMTERYTAQRAALMIKGPQNERTRNKRLASLDQFFVDYLESNRDALLSDPLAAERLSAEADQSYDQQRLRLLRQEVEKRGTELGLALTREADEVRYHQLRERAIGEISELSARCHDLMERYHCAGKDEEVLRRIFRNPSGEPSQSSTAASRVSDLESMLRQVLHQAEDRSIQHCLEAERRAIELFGVNRGILRLLPARFRARRALHLLEGQSPEEGQRLAQAFRVRYGESPFEYFRRTLNRFDAEQISHALQGNSTAVSAGELFELLRRRSPSAAAVLQFYRSLPPSAIKGVEAEFERRFQREPTMKGTSLSERLRATLTSEGVAELSARRDGDIVRADVFAILGLRSAPPRQREALRGIFLRFPGPNIKQLSEAFARETGGTLHQEAQRLPTGAARELCEAILAEDAPRTSLARMRAALQYKEDWVVEPFDGVPLAQRKAMIARYDETFHRDDRGSYWQDLQRALWMYDYGVLQYLPPLCRFFDVTNFPFPNSFPFIRALIERGTLQPHELLRFFMVGVGTDEVGIRRIFRSLSKEAIDQSEKEYHTSYPPNFLARVVHRIPILRQMFLSGSLASDLDSELSGDSLYDVHQLMRGRPHSAQEVRSQLEERLHHERSGRLLRHLKLERLVGVSIERARMEKDVQRALKFYEEHCLGSAGAESAALRQFEVLAQYARINLDTFRVIKNNIGCGISSLIAATGATLGTLPAVLFHEARYPVIATLAFLGSLGARWFVKSQIIGAAYQQKEKFWDSLYALADGLTLWLGRAAMTVSEFISIAGSRLAVRSGFRAGLRKIVKSIEDRIVHQNRRDYVPCPAELVGPERMEPPQHHLEAFEQWLGSEGRAHAAPSDVSIAISTGVLRSLTLARGASSFAPAAGAPATPNVDARPTSDQPEPPLGQ